ncbi:MAG: alanine racemase [Oliverpabstia sp.]|nr:alanine racemase [Oliverpabstia sp.]
MNSQEIVKSCIEMGKTPFYLFDLDMFASRIEKIKSILGENISLCYAMKANPFLIMSAMEKVDKLEVCSPGEFSICQEHQISMENIVLSGVYKEEKDVENVLRYGNGRGVYTVESLGQFQLLEREAGKHNLCISVLLRLTSGNQFGMDEQMIRELIRERETFPHVKILGLQYYSGTQKKRKKVLEEEVSRLDVLLKDLREEYGFQAEELEYGPGFYVPYFQKEEEEPITETMEDFRCFLERMEFSGKITLEIGRYLAAECGRYVTRIVDVKENQGQRYGIADGGIHHLNYYGQTMAMKVPCYVQLDGETRGEKQEGKESQVTICGSLCTVSDVLVKNLPLKGNILGDFLVFERAGAYSVTEGIYLFLSRDLPVIYFYSQKKGIELVRDTIPSSQLNMKRRK